VLASGNVATQAGSFALQREQILHKLPGLLLGGLRDLHAGRLNMPRQGTALLHLRDTDEAFSFGSGLRAFAVSLQHTLRWRRRLWYGGDTWFLALRRSRELLDPVAPDVGEVAALVAPSGRYWADPCIVECNGRRLMFVEEYSIHDNKGVIACLELLADNKARRLGIALERPWHLSYPQVFESDGTWYLTVESGSVRRASLYRAAGLPLLWEHVGDLLSGCQCVDPTLYRKDGYWYLFAGVSESGGSTCDELFLFVATALTGPYKPHPSNPIVRDVRRARPAGRLFERNGRLIRPAQDCAPDYGAAIVFNEVLELSPTRYRERELSRISPSWLPDLWGCHTYCSVGQAEVVDARGQVSAATAQIHVSNEPVLARDTTFSLPLVSVLMPVYNGEPFIAQAIESALAQTLHNIEVIVVDDGSTDSSGSIADRYAAANPGRVRVIHQPNAGLPLARNAAIAAARARYLALLDADDVWLPEHLSICVDILERDPAIGLVHADSEYIDAEGTRFTVEEEPRWGRDARDPYTAVLLRRQHIVCPTAVFRRSVVARVGQFDPAFNRLGCEDRDLWLRIAEASNVVYIEGVHALYRIHGSNMSANTDRMWRARKLLVEKYAGRSRGRPLLRRARAAIDADHGHELAREPQIGPAIAAFARALRRDPLRIDAWKGLLRRLLVGRRPGAIVRR
jgi:glycosyltransferase involved in cell wall biosynthesis